MKVCGSGSRGVEWDGKAAYNPTSPRICFSASTCCGRRLDIMNAQISFIVSWHFGFVVCFACSVVLTSLTGILGILGIRNGSIHGRL